MAITIRNILAAVATGLQHIGNALDIWRQESDPAAGAAAEMASNERDQAIAAGLIMAGGLDGFESVYAAQAVILERLHHDTVHQVWGDQLN